MNELEERECDFVKNSRILVTQSSMPPFDEYTEMIKPLWESHWLTNMGSYHKKLEQELEKFLNVSSISLMANGHMALELAIQSLGLQAGGEVITTPYTFISTTHAIIRNQLTPIFCDVKDDYTIDEEKIEDLITEKTVAIVPVHVYGNVCNVDKIQEIADKYDLKVVYDAAHAFGEIYKGKGIGNYGDLSVFSFHATKVYNTIEGGAVCCHNEEQYKKLYNLKNFGIRSEELVVSVGANAKMNEFQAAMGLCNLKYVNQAIEARKVAMDIYQKRLRECQEIILNNYCEELKPNYAYMPVLFKTQEVRDRIYEMLKEHNIFARKYFYPITADAACFRNKYRENQLVKEFLCALSEAVKEISNAEGKFDVDIELEATNITKMKVCYAQMKEEEREQVLNQLFELADEDIGIYVYLLSFLLDMVRDEKIVSIIDNILLESNLDVLDNINLYAQLNYFIFANMSGTKKVDRYKNMKKVHAKNLGLVEKKIWEFISIPAYIPYKQRVKKRVVLVIEPLLSIKHAPTKKMVNIISWLKKMQYEVLIFSPNKQLLEISRSAAWWKAVCSSTIFAKTTSFSMDYGITQLNGQYIMFNDDNYFEQISQALKRIYDYKPEYVMSVGDNCILADLCNQFTTVVTMGCTKNVPVTTAPIIARYFSYTEAEEKRYREMLDSYQTVIDVPHNEEKEEGGGRTYRKSDFMIPEDKFVVLIVGNRLDTEITETVDEILEQILNENEDVIIAFIGNCPKLEKRMVHSNNQKKYRFLGYQENLAEVMYIGDVFLNPPRQGGGGGAYYACQAEIPVITLGDCDCANVGEAFLCESLKDMPELVNKYIHDITFREKQKEYCRLKVKEWNSTNNLEQMEKLCNFVREYATQWDKEHGYEF